jgi:hypothetical protein
MLLKWLIDQNNEMPCTGNNVVYQVLSTTAIFLLDINFAFNYRLNTLNTKSLQG